MSDAVAVAQIRQVLTLFRDDKSLTIQPDARGCYAFEIPAGKYVVTWAPRHPRGYSKGYRKHLRRMKAKGRKG